MSCKGEGATHFACDCQLEQLAQLRAENDRLRKALEWIKAHMEIAAGPMKEVSAVYNVAREALKEGTK